MTAQQVEPTQEQDSWYNSIQHATFVEQTDEGFLFSFGASAGAEDEATPQRALVATREYQRAAAPEPGDEVSLLVERPRGDDVWFASVQKAEKLALWTRLEQMAEEGATAEGMFLGETRGGILVDLDGIRAFCPQSQIDLHRVARAADYSGQTGTFKVLKFKPERAEIVVSRREVLEQERDAARGELQDRLAPGQVHTGTVRNLRDFGAFIDIGGIDGLLHVSEMSWERVDQPHDLLSIGDEIEVSILNYNPETGRLGLTRKPLLKDPWVAATEQLEVGTIVEGDVVSVRDFGVFVELLPGVQGLVHLSELSWGERVQDAREFASPGDRIKVKLLNMDLDQKRIELSVKKTERDPWDEAAETIKEGATLTGTVRELAAFGAFVELIPGVQGLVHVSNISWTETVEHPDEHFTVGDEIEVRVLSVDTKKRRIGLGIKQLQNNPWDDAAAIAVKGKKIQVEITRLERFGAFAQIVEGVEGLIHVSELAEERVENPRSVVRPGQLVEALVLSFDPNAQRASLSLWRDSLDEEKAQNSYTDEGASSTFGDLLGAALVGAGAAGAAAVAADVATSEEE